MTEKEQMEIGRGGFCPKCGAVLLYLGATIGATKLWGCPNCGIVYWERVIEKGGK